MKRKGFLFEKLCTFENLLLSGQKAIKGKKDKTTVAAFHLNMEKELLKIQKNFNNMTYQPGPYHCFLIFEPKRRYICAADFNDRVVHHSVCNIIEPIFDKMYIFDSYACRKNKGSHKAIKRVQYFASENGFYLKADIKKYFESMDHEILTQLLERKIKDKKFLFLLRRIIEHPVPGYRPGKGVAIGNLTSQLFANFYLDFLDHYIKDELGVKHYVRYMDDFILLSNDKVKLHRLKADISRFLGQRLFLELKENASFIAQVKDGISFLGFRIFPNLIRLTHRNIVRFSKKHREMIRQYYCGHLTENQLIRKSASLIGHIGHADTLCMRQHFFYKDLFG
jgi:retron-type reverse transcriptase